MQAHLLFQQESWYDAIGWLGQAFNFAGASSLDNFELTLQQAFVEANPAE